MTRLGVQFQKPAPAVQAALDKAVFALMRRKSEARQTQPGERRNTTRVEISSGDQIAVMLLPDRPRGVLSVEKPASGPDLELIDLSTTGCALSCPDPCPLKPGRVIRLRLKGPTIDVELTGKVLYGNVA